MDTEVPWSHLMVVTRYRLQSLRYSRTRYGDRPQTRQRRKAYSAMFLLSVKVESLFHVDYFRVGLLCPPARILATRRKNRRLLTCKVRPEID